MISKKSRIGRSGQKSSKKLKKSQPCSSDWGSPSPSWPSNLFIFRCASISCFQVVSKLLSYRYFFQIFSLQLLQSFQSLQSQHSTVSTVFTVSTVSTVSMSPLSPRVAVSTVSSVATISTVYTSFTSASSGQLLNIFWRSFYHSDIYHT